MRLYGRSCLSFKTALAALKRPYFEIPRPAKSTWIVLPIVSVLTIALPLCTRMVRNWPGAGGNGPSRRGGTRTRYWPTGRPFRSPKTAPGTPGLCGTGTGPGAGHWPGHWTRPLVPIRAGTLCARPPTRPGGTWSDCQKPHPPPPIADRWRPNDIRSDRPEETPPERHRAKCAPAEAGYPCPTGPMESHEGAFHWARRSPQRYHRRLRILTRSAKRSWLLQNSKASTKPATSTFETG